MNHSMVEILERLISFEKDESKRFDGNYLSTEIVLGECPIAWIELSNTIYKGRKLLERSFTNVKFNPFIIENYLKEYEN